MPQMGESIFEGTITKWLKQPGEKVQRDEPLFEISTDKVDAEIPAPASGTLQDIKVQAGATVQVNTVVGTIAAEGEAAGAAPSTAAAPPPKPAAAAGDGSRSTQTEVAQPPKGEQPQAGAAGVGIEPTSNRVTSSPRPRKPASRDAFVPARWYARLRKTTMLIWRGSQGPDLAAASLKKTSSHSSPSTAQKQPSSALPPSHQRLRSQRRLSRLQLRPRLPVRWRRLVQSRRARLCPCRSCARRLRSAW